VSQGAARCPGLFLFFDRERDLFFEKKPCDTLKKPWDTPEKKHGTIHRIRKPGTAVPPGTAISRFSKKKDKALSPPKEIPEKTTVLGRGFS